MALSPEMMKLIKGAKNRFSRSNAKTVKMKEGRTGLRIVQVEENFFRELGVHWIKDENGKVAAVVGCSDVVYGRPCPIDAAIDKASKVARDDATVNLISEWKTRKSVLVIAIVRDGADASPDPQIVELTPTTFGSLMAMCEEYGADVDPFDPVEGLDFIITRSGKGKETEYKVMPKLKGSAPLTKDQLAKAKDIDLDAFIEKEFFKGDENKALNCIAAVTGVSLAIAPPARAAGLLTGSSSRVEDADEAPAAPAAPVTRRPAAKPAPEPEEPVEAEFVEAPKPAPRKPAPAAPAAAKPAPAADEFDAPADDPELQALLNELDVD